MSDVILTIIYTLRSLPLSALFYAEERFGEVEYDGWGLIKYYLFVIEDHFADYSWQIVTAYIITVGSLVALCVLLMMFFMKVMVQHRRDRKEAKLYEYFSDKFHTILGSAEMLTPDQMLEILGKTNEEIMENDTYYYANMLEEVRVDMYEIVCLPNMQTLAAVLGVIDKFELQLLKRKNVFRTLQMLLMLQITVSEGLLATFVNHTNPEIRMMARLNYITCSMDAPYRYLIEELNIDQPPYMSMILNYVFGWMMFQDRLMPNFLNMADRVQNETMAAYLVHEVAYWGKDNEKEMVREYFLDKRPKVRSAAIEVVATLGDVAAEDKLIDSYYHQPEHIRREVLRAVLALNSGKRTEFFKKAYDISSSRETHATALHCMYQYGNSGRRLFEIMRSEADDESRELMDQVDATVLLEQLQVI